MAKKHTELVAKEGWVFFFPLLLAAIVSFLLHWNIAAWLLLLLAVYVACFFRNPYRQIPEEADVIVSPADGKVVGVHQLEDGRHLVTIFLNVFNVHINRSPIGGTIDTIEYTAGKYLAAYKEEASTQNERNRLVIRDGDFCVEVTQIAGLIARRIVCWAREAETLLRGERFGLIRFGSRMDVILPSSCQVVVVPGQKVAGGCHIIARRTDLSTA